MDRRDFLLAGGASLLATLPSHIKASTVCQPNPEDIVPLAPPPYPYELCENTVDDEQPTLRLLTRLNAQKDFEFITWTDQRPGDAVRCMYFDRRTMRLLGFENYTVGPKGVLPTPDAKTGQERVEVTLFEQFTMPELPDALPVCVNYKEPAQDKPETLEEPLEPIPDPLFAPPAHTPLDLAAR